MSGKRQLITTLLDLFGVALVAVGLVGYDWRVAVVVIGVLILVISRINK